MSPANCHAWILLSVPEDPATLDRVIGIADAVNHAIPTHQELQDSLGFLRASGMIVKNEHCYHLADAGRTLLANVRNLPTDSIFDIWNRLESELSRIELASYEPDNLPASVVADACATYNTRFWEQYQQLTAKGEV